MKYFLVLCWALSAMSCNGQAKPYIISATAFNDSIKSSKNAIILDVRTPAEFESGAIENAINMDYREAHFEDKMNAINHNKTYFVYCLSGGRSGEAVKWMKNNGFKNVYGLEGGVLAWQKNNFSITHPTVNPAEDKISEQDYQQIIHSEKIVIVDFYAPWCGPCKQMQPMIEELSKSYEGKAKIIRINIDENKALTRKLRIDEIPFFKYYLNGEEKGNYIGQVDKATFIKLLNP